jgi:hypothetical protein
MLVVLGKTKLPTLKAGATRVMGVTATLLARLPSV